MGRRTIPPTPSRRCRPGNGVALRAILASLSLAQARAVAFALPPDDRLTLALELLESAEPEDEGAEEAWEAEIGRRVERLDRDEVLLLPTTDVLRRIGR
jgi:putative addiction module component (TIGR02574 family)